MTLNEEFIKVLSAEIKEKPNNLLVLHKCLLKFKNSGMDKDSMIKNLIELRIRSDSDAEDVLLELMDFVEGFCNPNLSIF